MRTTLQAQLKRYSETARPIQAPVSDLTLRDYGSYEDRHKETLKAVQTYENSLPPVYEIPPMKDTEVRQLPHNPVIKNLVKLILNP
jgi:hypothetical protein